MGLKREVKLLREELRVTKEALNLALERIVEDIEQPKTKNTKHLIHRCYCKKCDKLVEPEIKDALPNARFGLRLMILVLILKLDSRIPINKIVSLLSSVFGINISDGEIYGILRQLKTAF